MKNYTRRYYQTTQENVASAREVVPFLFKLFQPRSVVDVGCGSGAWLAAFRELGVDDVTGYDGDWVERQDLLIPETCLHRHDLAKALSAERTYDLAISLEVGEHLSPECAPTLVQSLSQLSSAVLFSAAVPYQGGTNHINEQWPGYWVELFNEIGYATVDCLRMRFWDNPRVRWWYAQNMLLFVSEERLTSYPDLVAQWKSHNLNGVSLVHPRRWEKQCDPSKLPLKNAVMQCSRVISRNFTGFFSPMG
jgi:hypothetical protein